MEPTFNLQEYVTKLRTMYTADIAQGTFNLLLIGGIGDGKTHLTSTARKPIVYHSFDPGGTKLPCIKRLTDEGMCIIDTRFEKEDPTNPTAFDLWDKEFRALVKTDFFQHIGTYVIDSFSLWMDACINKLAKIGGRKGGVLEIQDWQILRNVMRDSIKLCTAIPCDFICTGHLVQEMETFSGKFVSSFQAPPSLQNALPALFDEIWVIRAIENAQTKKSERLIYSSPTGKVQARTRIGSEKFSNPETVPDIKVLLTKAGMATDDKPKL